MDEGAFQLFNINNKINISLCLKDVQKTGCLLLAKTRRGEIVGLGLYF